jgi:hypothetical protein
LGAGEHDHDAKDCAEENSSRKGDHHRFGVGRRIRYRGDGCSKAEYRHQPDHEQDAYPLPVHIFLPMPDFLASLHADTNRG